ncbi:MAG: glycosyltransferase [Pseudomonadales bacterium]
MLVTSIGRLTAQKMQLLQHAMSDGRSALDHLLERLGDAGILILLGSGDPVYEAFLRKCAARARNLVYLQGYSDTLVDDLYASGDLFLMPSLYEPCGISQMLAMRAGQPCLVHSVGGLADTVQDAKNGFAFSGADIADSAAAMLDRFDAVVQLRSNEAAKWKKIASAAQKSRFTWESAAESYLDLLYAPAGRMQ